MDSKRKQHASLKKIIKNFALQASFEGNKWTYYCISYSDAITY